TSYGCDFVFHPVREAVALKTTSFFNKDTTLEFNAPLYGGPGMDARDPSWVLAVYEGFTPKTSFLTSRDIAKKTLINNASVVRIPFKRGSFYLLGPHLEHPGYEQANQFIINAMILETAIAKDHVVSNNPAKAHTPTEKITGKKAKALLLSIRRELSNSRIVASNLEFLPVQWLIGQKTYEPQKVRVYLESMWKRLMLLEKEKELSVESGLADRITIAAKQTTSELRRMKQQLDQKQDSLKTAIIIFDLLHTLSIGFFDLYFATLANNPVTNNPINGMDHWQGSVISKKDPRRCNAI
ncbi:MAG: hypothetical protein GY729_15810, partial [Desulfobacteraceae bacterium]|nr:hypothetical protein [Desulfobacteraceae bacterium]